MDLVSLLLNSSKDSEFQYSDKEMVAECFSVYIAGHDTTATAASILLCELANYSEIQAKIRAEIKAIATSNGHQANTLYMPK
jgi:cytochrome P450